ncbi:MAG: glycoside hydrolase family 16 protein [Marmoricola sp.]|nr:glycoside hydrolase family 16 protein [Marmoricola sp.]
MFRVFLVLATIAGAVAFCWDRGLLDETSLGKQLVSSNESGDSHSVMDRPAIRVLTAPDALVLREDGTVDVQAESPAAPGDPVILNTAGAYGLGYVRVSTGTLDEDLRATLAVPGRKFLGSYKYWATIPASATYQEGQSASFAIKIVTTPPPEAPSCAGEPQIKADDTPWECTFDDEFDGQSLDRRYWVAQDSSTTGTKTRFACAEDSPETIDVQDGTLRLSLVEHPDVRRCTRSKSSTFAYGQVMHFQTFSQAYGKWEVRAKVPDLDVPGSQQSFWLWPKKNTYGGWPASGEIDFAELYSSTPGIDKPFLHYLPGTTGATPNENLTHAACDINRGEYNTYGVEWEPRKISVMLNGKVCFTDEYSSITASFQGKNSPFDQPFYLSLNQAMGAIGNEYDPDLVPDRVTTLIDYVRIWK